MNPEDSAQLARQLKPMDSEWNSALLSVANKNTEERRFVIDLRALNKKCKKYKPIHRNSKTEHAEAIWSYHILSL